MKKITKFNKLEKLINIGMMLPLELNPPDCDNIEPYMRYANNMMEVKNWLYSLQIIFLHNILQYKETWKKNEKMSDIEWIECILNFSFDEWYATTKNSLLNLCITANFNVSITIKKLNELED
ncbi:MAG: hypothetical protein RR623_04740 [Bacilli bacterium]